MSDIKAADDQRTSEGNGQYPSIGFVVSECEREHTLLMIKPDGIQRSLIGKTIKRFEAKGLKLVAIKFIWPSEDQLKKHYVKKIEMPFCHDFMNFMRSGPIIPMVWEGLNAVKIGRQLLCGADRLNPLPGTIRGDFGSNDLKHRFTIAHASDSVEEANREIALWFNKNELVVWNASNAAWIYKRS